MPSSCLSFPCGWWLYRLYMWNQQVCKYRGIGTGAYNMIKISMSLLINNQWSSAPSALSNFMQPFLTSAISGPFSACSWRGLVLNVPLTQHKVASWFLSKNKFRKSVLDLQCVNTLASHFFIQWWRKFSSWLFLPWKVCDSCYVLHDIFNKYWGKWMSMWMLQVYLVMSLDSSLKRVELLYVLLNIFNKNDVNVDA